MRTRLGSMSPAGGPVIPPTIEFPSQRRERIDWHKLASVDLHDLAKGCSIEFLQENISHVTFCDAESEFDVGTVSGQRNLLKMYRLAQLIIQYLFLSQEFIETQLQEAQEEVQQVKEKYQQAKSKLLQQVEEAKKMKATNKSMRETVKYVNSVALSNGFFQPSKCPFCCKTFRGHEFLQSHLWRKHPNQANSVVLPQASTSTHVLHQASTSTHVFPEASTSTHLGAMSARNVDNKHLEVPSGAPDISVPTPESTKTNDVDTYRLLEIERKFDLMNDNFNRIFKDMENQKHALERENEKRQDEVKKAWEEKQDLEKGYESQLNKLSDHISQLQNTEREQTTPVRDERFIEHIRNQEAEIKALKSRIEKQSRKAGVGSRDDDLVDGISNELQDLKMQLQQQKKNHKQSLAQIQDNLRMEYENALETEKARLREMMEDFARQESDARKLVRQESKGKANRQGSSGKIIHQDSQEKVAPHKPPPSPKVPASKPPVPDKSTKSPVKSPDMYEDSVRTFSYSHDSGSDSIYARGQKLSLDSESESETDTSQWNQSNLKIQQLQITSTDNEDRTHNSLHKVESSNESEESSAESGEEESTEEEDSSESLTLDTLLKENPQLWSQMRSATSEVLMSKLSLLGLQSSVKGIKSDVLTSCLSQLRKGRRTYEEKYDNFIELRKRLGNEVTGKLDDKIENAENFSGSFTPEDTTKSNKKRRQSGVLSKVVHNVRSKVKESSKALSKTGESVKSGVKEMFQTDSKSTDIKVLSRPGSNVSKHQKKQHAKVSSSSSDEESENSSAGSAQVEVHNETSKSVSRNLFGGGPIQGGSGIQTKQGNFFENKTYGQVDEEDISSWDSDSDPEYENVRKAEPPKRSDSLDATSDFMEYPGVSTNGWDVPEDKPIKLKKPAGEKVSSLSRTIEFQLSGRTNKKMAGAVDIMGGLPGTSHSSGGLLEPPGSLQSTPSGSQQHIQSVSDSSNTIPTSLWGSAEVVNKPHKVKPKPSTSKVVTQSWDSEDDLEISEIE